MKTITLALAVAFVPAGAIAGDDLCSCEQPRPLANFSGDPLIEPMDNGLIPSVTIDASNGCSVTINFIEGEQTTYELDGGLYLMFQVPTQDGDQMMSLDGVHEFTNVLCGQSPPADAEVENAVTS